MAVLLVIWPWASEFSVRCDKAKRILVHAYSQEFSARQVLKYQDDKNVPYALWAQEASSNFQRSMDNMTGLVLDLLSHEQCISSSNHVTDQKMNQREVA